MLSTTLRKGAEHATTVTVVYIALHLVPKPLILGCVALGVMVAAWAAVVATALERRRLDRSAAAELARELHAEVADFKRM